MNAPPRKKKNWKLPTIVGVSAGLVGVGIGATSQPEPEVVTETVTEEVEVETVVTEEVEVEVEVERTPQACLDAIINAEGIYTELIGAIEHYLDAVDSASVMDYESATASLDSGTGNVDYATMLLESFNSNAYECESK